MSTESPRRFPRDPRGAVHRELAVVEHVGLPFGFAFGAQGSMKLHKVVKNPEFLSKNRNAQ